MAIKEKLIQHPFYHKEKTICFLEIIYQDQVIMDQKLELKVLKQRHGQQILEHLVQQRKDLLMELSKLNNQVRDNIKFLMMDLAMHTLTKDLKVKI